MSESSSGADCARCVIDGEGKMETGLGGAIANVVADEVGERRVDIR